MKDVLKVGVSGVRGIVGRSLTPQLAASFAQAFGVFVGRGPVVVGRDTRPSGPMLEQAVIAALASVGCRPLLAGILPTPSLLVLVKARGARGGIAITASHNPPEWNALKFVGADGLFLDEARVEEMLDVYHQQDFPLAAEREIPRCAELAQPVDEHFKRVLGYVDVAGIRARRFRVAMDCCNGVGAVYSVPFLRDRLGCEVLPLYDRPTGLFEREPEPRPQNLKTLCQAVRTGGAAVGFAQDPDGDRLTIVDEQGEALDEDLTLALAAWQVLERHGRGPVVINQTTSRCIEDVARRFGCPVTRSKIGEINVVGAMLKIGAVVGGESNGGVIIPAIHPCRDSYAAMAVILELMAATGRPLSELRAEIPRYFIVREKLSVRTEQMPFLLRGLRQAYAGAEQSQLDGLMIHFADAWVQIRRSNTEPVVRITSEARSPEQAAQLAVQARERISRLLASLSITPEKEQGKP